MHFRQLIKWNEQGLIPGPEESDAAFHKRCMQLTHEKGAIYAVPLFELRPDWVQISFSNKDLHFWEGGCAWVGKNGEVTLQLRASFAKRQKYLGLYSKEELLSHELVHAARSAFSEPQFEEVLAYQTSPSWLRRMLGPLFRSSKDSLLFLGGMLGGALLTLWPPGVLLGWALMGSLCAGGFWRALRLQSTFRRAKKRLAVVLKCEKKALAAMMRLTDQEIRAFAKSKPFEIELYAEQMKSKTLRWKQLYVCYFLKRGELVSAPITVADASESMQACGPALTRSGEKKP